MNTVLLTVLLDDTWYTGMSQWCCLPVCDHKSQPLLGVTFTHRVRDRSRLYCPGYVKWLVNAGMKTSVEVIISKPLRVPATQQIECSCLMQLAPFLCSNCAVTSFHYGPNTCASPFWPPCSFLPVRNNLRYRKVVIRQLHSPNLGRPVLRRDSRGKNFNASRIQAVVAVVTAGLCLFIMIQGKHELFQHL